MIISHVIFSSKLFIEQTKEQQVNVSLNLMAILESFVNLLMNYLKQLNAIYIVNEILPPHTLTNFFPFAKWKQILFQVVNTKFHRYHLYVYTNITLQCL